MFTVEVKGFAEIDKALSELPKALARNILSRALLKSGEPVKIAAQATAPVKAGGLKGSIAVSTRLNRSQRKQRLKKGVVEVYVGPSQPKGAHGYLVEWGTRERSTRGGKRLKIWAYRGMMPARPFLRPAWDATKDTVLKVLTVNLKEEIDKAVKRLVKKYKT